MLNPSPIEPDRQRDPFLSTEPCPSPNSCSSAHFDGPEATSSTCALGSRFLADERGETALEYGLIASLVILALLATLTQLGNSSTTMYGKISNAMTSGH